MRKHLMSLGEKAHCLIAYAFCLILITENNAHCFVAHLLCLKMIRDCYYRTDHVELCSLRIGEVRTCPKALIFISDNF